MAESDEDEQVEEPGDANGWIRYPSFYGEREYAKMWRQKGALMRDVYHVREKVDGANVAVVVKPNDAPLVWYSRTMRIPPTEKFYGLHTEVAGAVEDLLRTAAKAFGSTEPVILYGELFGKFFPNEKGGFPSKAGSVQKRVCYSSKLKVRFFDAFFPEKRTWVDQTTFSKCLPPDLRVDPVFTGTFEECVAWCEAHHDFTTRYSDADHQGVRQLAEGFVITHTESWPKLKHRLPSFLEKSVAPSSAFAMGELTKALTEADVQWRTYLTKNRMCNVASKRVGGAPLSLKDMAWLVTEVKKDILEDMAKDGAPPEWVAAVDSKVIGSHLRTWVLES
jgi:Rnl2 family RNA ligase